MIIANTIKMKMGGVARVAPPFSCPFITEVNFEDQRVHSTCRTR